MKAWMQLNILELEQIGNFNFPLNKTNKQTPCMSFRKRKEHVFFKQRHFYTVEAICT